MWPLTNLFCSKKIHTFFQLYYTDQIFTAIITVYTINLIVSYKSST